MAKVVLFGHREMARMTCFYLRHDSPHEVVAFTVDGSHIAEESMLGLPIVPFEEVQTLYPPEDHMMGLPIAFSGVNRVRAAKCAEAKAKGYQLITYVSSRAMTWPDLAIGENCFVFEGSVLGPFVTIGDDVIVAGASVGHDSVIGDHCFLAAHAVVLGTVNVGPYSILGANSTLRDGITIGSGCVIGAGVTMTKSAPDLGVYASKHAERLARTSDKLSGWINWPVR